MCLLAAGLNSRIDAGTRADRRVMIFFDVLDILKIDSLHEIEL